MKTFSSSSSSSDMLPITTSSVHVWLSKHLHSDSLIVELRDTQNQNHCSWKLLKEFPSERVTQFHMTRTCHLYLETYLHLRIHRVPLRQSISQLTSRTRITLTMSLRDYTELRHFVRSYRPPNNPHAQISSKCTCPMTYVRYC